MPRRGIQYSGPVGASSSRTEKRISALDEIESLVRNQNPIVSGGRNLVRGRAAENQVPRFPATG